MKLISISQCIIFFSMSLFRQETNGQDKISYNTKPTSFGLSAGWQYYQSFSQQKTGIPVGAGYPVIKAHLAGISVKYKIDKPDRQHSMKLTFFLPSSLDSDNGTGNNYLLDTRKSMYYRIEAGYRLSAQVFQRRRLTVGHEFLCGLLFENRKLTFPSGTSENSEDINFYSGPGLVIQYKLSDKWKVSGAFESRFYLPYANFGRKRGYDPDGSTIFSTGYRAFYYQSVYRTGISYLFSHTGELFAGIGMNNLTGFANREPLFHVRDAIHFKLDRLFRIYIGYNF